MAAIDLQMVAGLRAKQQGMASVPAVHYASRRMAKGGESAPNECEHTANTKDVP